MLNSLLKIFEEQKVETPSGEKIRLHSQTSREQGLFLQDIFDMVKPQSSLEVGMAYGISSLFILEKHKQYNNQPKSHLIIEPYPWGGVAENYFRKERLFYLADIRYKKSDEVLPMLYFEDHRIQFAYVDTTKLFDVVMQDVYFISKILDVGGILVLDDCGGYWPGVQKVIRFINILPHFKFLRGHNPYINRTAREVAERITSAGLSMVPFKKKFIPGFNLKTNRKLDLEYHCIAFQKIANDNRKWDWDGLL